MMAEQKVKRYTDREQEVVTEIQKRKSKEKSEALASKDKSLATGEDLASDSFIAIRRPHENTGENGPDHGWEKD